MKMSDRIKITSAVTVKGGIMGIVSIILIVIWLSFILEGVYGIVKGYFYHEQNKVDKHDPDAYRKWVRLSSVFCMICGVLNAIWCILDAISENSGFIYIILIIITVVVTIAVTAVSYRLIVKPADQKIGIESEFDKILKNNK